MFSELFIFEIIKILLVFLFGIYLYIKYYIYNYWFNRGYDYIKPVTPFGNIKSFILGKRNLSLTINDLYFQTDKKYTGIFLTIKPMLLLRDPEFVKQIFIKDFEYFVDRGFYSNSERDPFSAHLVCLNGDEWKYMRQKISSALTNGKLKHMFPCIVKVGETLQQYIDTIAISDNNVIEIKDIMARFTTDLIVSVAFGLEINSINNPNEMFRKIGQKVVDPGFETLMRLGLTVLAPSIMESLKIKATNSEVEIFITSIVKQMLEYREKNNIVREDFMQLLIQLRNSGSVNEDGVWNTRIVNENYKQLSLGQICAQTYAFFVAGFETTSSAIAFTLFEIAKNENIQKRLQEDIDDGLKKYDNKLIYESENDFKYLGQCFDETMRMYPSIPFFTRYCTKEYKIPNTDLIIEKGTSVIIPVLALHNDPKYFKNPDVYDPDRFSFENKKAHIPISYIPFGDGPRNCIGMKMAKVQAKAGLALLISKFNFELAPNRNPTIEFDTKSPILRSVNGIELKVTRRIKN